MIISLNWLKKFTIITMPVEELATLIGARLVEIESLESIGQKYDGVIVARVVSCDKHEDSDHLNVVKIDDGGAVQDVDRDDNGYVQVVCGAPNIRQGLVVAWLPPGSTVPETAGSADPFVLGARQLRGVMSNGMIASARELALFDEHEGILELSDSFSLGKTFASQLELDDTLFDIENKSLTHRPDCFGIIGFAREVAAIQGESFHTPDWLKNSTPDFSPENTTIQAPRITIDEKLSRCYRGVVLSNADATKKSPLEIQTFLARVGVRPINAVVDVTNYLMMLTGQPLHTYDYDKILALGGSDIAVRAAKKGETLTLIDGSDVTMDIDDIMIAAHDQPIGLAGAMGGANSEIDATTKNILLEAATFDLYKLRATQMRHGVFSEAMTRFTKGQPAELGAAVLKKAIELLGEWAGAKQVSEVGVAAIESPRIEISLSQEKINHTLGLDLPLEKSCQILRRTEFEVREKANELIVSPPYWRTDIHIPEDVIEEIGRLNGFDEIAPRLPLRDFTSVRPSDFDELRSSIRQSLVKSGANEALTYSFVHGDILRKVGQNPEHSYRITNSISPDLQYYRQSLIPSLLTLARPNVKRGFDEFCLFELNKTHSKINELNHEHVPAELHRVGLLYVNKKTQPGAPFFRMKRIVTQLAKDLKLNLVYKAFEAPTTLAIAAPFLPARTARIIDQKSGQVIGVIGEFSPKVQQGLKLPEYTAGAELITSAIALAQKHAELSDYSALSRFPSTSRDVCFAVDEEVSVQQILDAVELVRDEIAEEMHFEVLDIYQPDQKTTKKITLRVTIVSHEKTLQSTEITQIITKISHVVSDTTGAVVE